MLSIIEAYYDFLSAQLYYVAYDELASQADTIGRQIEIQVNAGLRCESEALLSKSNLAHLKVEMLNAQRQYYRQSAELVRSLNLDPTIRLVSTDSVMAPITLTENDFSISDSLYTRRPEVQALMREHDALHTMRKTTTTGLLIPSSISLTDTMLLSNSTKAFAQIPLYPPQYNDRRH